ncbi:Protein of unknown function DUF1376 [uncultured Caudovirales phage]|uniref:DUF1376 domain-containing protein n=1 Tax=uncultured Caudovirales phage TaxID=2100421 RepID=A0A6J5N2W0_9CAUD|nr:Protein of unknown function DUF1376 [uncultured Caudovirales phage]
MHYYQHHIGDFIKDTSFLTNEEIGIYMKLIWLYYDTEKPLTKDFSMLAIKVGARDKEISVCAMLNMYFDEQEDGWHHSRCDKEIAEYHGFIESKSKAGKASAERRLNMKSTGVEQVLNTKTTDVQLTTNHKPLTTNQIKHTPVGFDLFWDAYDKKVGKPNSLKAWSKIAFKDDLLQKIVEKAKADKKAKPDNKFRKDPERWLKGQHWLDEVVIEQAPESKELPLGTDAQIEAAYRAECGDPSRARFNSYYEMRNFIVSQREKRKAA